MVLDQVLQHRGDVVVGVPRLAFLRSQTADVRGFHRPSDGLATRIPAVEAHREKGLRTHQHPGDLRLRTPLRPRQKGPPVHPPTGVRVDAVRLDDERVELIVQLNRLADNVTGAVAEVLLDVRDDLVAQ